MGNLRLIIIFFFCVNSLLAQKLLPYMTTSGDKGYVSETALAVDDALVWKVGGNTVAAHRILGTNAAYDLVFHTNSTERMRISASGNVGIGTLSPSSKIDVNGDIVISNSTTTYSQGNIFQTGLFTAIGEVQNSSRTILGNNIRPNASPGNTNLIANYRNAAFPSSFMGVANDFITFHTNITGGGVVSEFSNERLRINPSGFIGIGTTIPNSLLSIVGSEPHISISGVINGSAATPSYMGLDFFSKSNNYKVAQIEGISQATNYTQGGLRFNVASNIGSGVVEERMRIDGTNGYVGINTTSPTSMLDVNGVIKASSIQISGASSGASTDSMIVADATLMLKKRTITSVLNTHYSNNQLTGGFGATTAGGALNWNDATNARSGNGYSLLLGSATGGMGDANYYHNLSFEYSSKDGSGNLTQLAVPYFSSPTSTLFFRSRFNGTWSSWYSLLTQQNADTRYIPVTEMTNLAKIGNNNTFSGTNTFSNTIYVNSALSSAIWGNVDGVLVKNNTDNSLRYASKSLFLLNNGNTNAAQVSFGTNDNNDAIVKQNGASRLTVSTNTTNITNSQYTELTTTNGAQPSVKLVNSSNGRSSAIFLTSNMDYTTANFTSNGDLAIDPVTAEMTITKGYKRQDIHFETNAKQLANVSFTDTNDSCFVNVTSTTRYVRVYKSSAITTTKLRVNLPANPQNNCRITILCETDPTSIDVKADNAGQTIISAYARFTPVAGELIECWFDADTDGASTGKWYIKKI